MSIKSDEPFEIPVFLRKPAPRAGGPRLPRTSDFRVPPRDLGSESGDGQPNEDLGSAPTDAHDYYPLILRKRWNFVPPIAAFLVALAAVVAVIRIPAFDALISGGGGMAKPHVEAAAVEPSPSTFLQGAFSAQGAASESSASDASSQWSSQAARLQREAPEEPAPVAAVGETSNSVAAALSAAEVASTSAPPALAANPPGVTATPPAAASEVVADTTPPATAAEPVVHGLSDKEIRFGMVSPFTGANKEAGRQLKLGVDVAFAQANEAGGVNGRQLKLIAVDDGYEPARTLAAMQELYDKDDVFGFIGNFGTATAAISVPYALEHKSLFLGALSGGGLLRRDPPDRYVFNYRPSYSEETGAALRYLVKVRRINPRDIAVFTQMDPFGDAGFDGVTKAMRSLPEAPEKVLRIGYKRNSIDVQDAVAQLRATKGHIKAVIMVATYRAAAKFIEKTREAVPGLIYTNVSAVGATSLADELMLLGPRYAEGVVVTQVTPAVSSSASFVLKYKAALAKYFPGEAPDYTSLESYIDADILIEALKRSGRQIDTEKLVDTFESLRELDFGLGTVLRYSANEHQGSHKVWGTELDERGQFQPIDLE